MSAYTLVLSKRFKKGLRRLSPIDQSRVVAKFKDLKAAPFYPSFRNKPFYGRGLDYYESRISRDLRIFWYFKGSRIIVLDEVGHHDLVK